MNEKIPATQAHAAAPKRDQQQGGRSAQPSDQHRQYAPRDQALEFAAMLAQRNAELMRRLA